MPTNIHDVEAQICFLSTEESGRRIPFYSGVYRPQFYYDDQHWDAIFFCDDREYVEPGETVVAYLSFLSPDMHLGKLYPGKGFLLCAGQRILAKGKVTRIIDLEQSARRMAALRPQLEHNAQAPLHQSHERKSPQPGAKRTKKRKQQR